MHPRAAELIGTLRLEPHPEGGRYRRVYTSTTQLLHNGTLRPVATAIHYLLCAGEISRWHRIDADEIWQHHEGDALELMLFDATSGELHRHRLGRSDTATNSQPLIGVPAGVWQAARPLGDYALVGCGVAPGFDFAGFILLDADATATHALAQAAPDLLRYR
ncbi:MAG: cupin domain-containing protein [Rudaea sp.]|uniref:cupin domain-containing protein n=1 Tax=Rudaea sp. TaxID=2136325 RepID=UPI0039E6351B